MAVVWLRLRRQQKTVSYPIVKTAATREAMATLSTYRKRGHSEDTGENDVAEAYGRRPLLAGNVSHIKTLHNRTRGSHGLGHGSSVRQRVRD